MSRMRSTPRTIAIPSIGTPTMPEDIMRSGSSARDAGGADRGDHRHDDDDQLGAERQVDANTWARNSTVAPSNSEVPFMLSVAPSGSTKPATSRGRPSSSRATRIDVGSVALLDEVENA